MELHVTLELVSAIMLTINIIIIKTYFYHYNSVSLLFFFLLSASHLLGLTVLLDAKSESYFVTPEDYVGFKVQPCQWLQIILISIASFTHHFASLPHQICLISPNNCIISPTSCFISPTDCFSSPKKFSLPQHYFASLCQKLEHNLTIVFLFFFIFGA